MLLSLPIGLQSRWPPSGFQLWFPPTGRGGGWAIMCCFLPWKIDWLFDRLMNSRSNDASTQMKLGFRNNIHNWLPFVPVLLSVCLQRISSTTGIDFFSFFFFSFPNISSLYTRGPVVLIVNMQSSSSWTCAQVCATDLAIILWIYSRTVCFSSHSFFHAFSAHRQTTC